MTKEEFLESLKSKTTGKYKRYRGSTLRYAGGKSLAVGKLIEYIPENVNKIVSPFMGGGSMEIALAKELGKEVIAYDIFDLLVNYWQQQIAHPKELADKLKNFKLTKEEYKRIKELLKEHWTKENGYDGKLDPLDAAALYYYNMQLSFGPSFLGWMSKNYVNNDKTYANIIKRVNDFNVPNLEVRKGSFSESIPNHQGDFLYLDPPYYLDGDSKMNKGLYPANDFPIFHKGFDHQLLADLLKAHRGGFLLSYNDCSWIRDTYKDYEIIPLKWQYTFGQGETRIGKDRLSRDYDNTNVKTSHEVLIIGK